MSVMLSRLDELIRWFRLNFKPKKSRSLSIVKAKVVTISLSVADQLIFTVLGEPVKGLGECTMLTDKKEVRIISESKETGLLAIDRNGFVGKLKIWCLKFTRIHQKLYCLFQSSFGRCLNISTIAVERKINVVSKKLLRMTPGLSAVTL